MSYNGIVFSHDYHATGKIVILDHTNTCIATTYKERPLSPGFCIRYTMITYTILRSFVHSLEIIESPLANVKENLHFVHYIIDLCLTFVPIGIYNEGLYDLLYSLYTTLYKTSHDKKIFLYHLFRCIGIYPQLTLDRSEIRFLDLENEKILTEWLRAAYCEISDFRKNFYHPLLYDIGIYE